MDGLKHSLWVEKYRPMELKNYVGNEHLKVKVQKYIEEKDIPHLLLYGKAGTGKTTLAKLIINNIECDHLYINASDENSVDAVRFKIRAFASTVGFKDMKVVILDECDYLTPNAQAALRNVMETFSKHCRFILTCNYVERVIDPIQSRCQSYKIVPPTKSDVARQLNNILNKEQVESNIDDIKIIVDSNYPDIRRVINSAQRQVVNDTLVIDKSSVVHQDFKLKLINMLKTKQSFNKMRQLIADNSVNDFAELFRYLYDEVDHYSGNHGPECIIAIAEGQYRDVQVVDKEINFMSALLKISQIV